jgi:putative glutamine amidotransferase
MRPLIGITSYEAVVWGAWNVRQFWCRRPIHAPSSAQVAGPRRPPGRVAVESCSALDGLVFSGGGDVDPGASGAEAHDEVRGVNPKRDEAELELLRGRSSGHACSRRAAVDQVLNVALGGDLVQHCPGRRPRSAIYTPGSSPTTKCASGRKPWSVEFSETGRR